MCKTNPVMCRICLTSSKDDNISDSSCYTDFFIQFIGKNMDNNLFLCMWCKSMLRKFVTLRKLALKSEKISLQEDMLTDKNCQKSLHTLSQTSIMHTDVSPHHASSNHRQIITLNEEFVINEDINVINNSGNNINEVNMEREIDLNEVYIKENNQAIHFINEEIEFKNEMKMHSSDFTVSHIEQRTEDNSHTIENKMPLKKHNKKKIKNNETEIIRKRNKIELRLQELKFDVKYLNLEEQLKEIEMKKMKYKNMKFQCDLCGIGFLTSDYFEEHKIKHTKASGMHRCGVCSLHFRTPLVLAQHTLAHRRQFSCVVCGARVCKWSNCSSHRQRCGTDVVCVECQHCHKVFSDDYSLKVHNRLHTVQKQYSCEHCAAQFTTKQRLIVHIRSHTGQKPFQCVQCNRCFSTNSNLKAHLAVHSEESRHYCVECNTHYKTAKSLKRHLSECVRHAHERHHMYSCEQCPKRFSSAHTLACHVARHADTPQLACPHCHKTFSNKSNLCKHLKSIHKDIAIVAKSSDST